MMAVAAIAAAAMNMAPVPNVIAIRNRSEPQLLSLDRLLPRSLHIGRSALHGYIRRPLHTVAQMKRRARKARNVRRHKLAMKRRGAR